MTAQPAQYDHIGRKYDEYAHTATLKRAEQYTFFRLVGALQGKRVLDLASGLGFYTRQLKQRGAAQVLGVDISPEVARIHDRAWGVGYPQPGRLGGLQPARPCQHPHAWC